MHLLYILIANINLFMSFAPASPAVNTLFPDSLIHSVEESLSEHNKRQVSFLDAL